MVNTFELFGTNTCFREYFNFVFKCFILHVVALNSAQSQNCILIIN